MRLGLKLNIIFFSIVAIPLFFVGTLVFNNTKENFLIETQNKLNLAASLEARNISSLIRNLKTNIYSMQDYYNIKFNLPKITATVNNRQGLKYRQAKTMLDNQLKTWIKHKEGIIDIMLVAPDGKIVYTVNPEHETKDLGNLLPDPSNLALKKGKKSVYITEVFKNKRENNLPFLLIAGSANDLNENFIGLIVLEINMAFFYKQLANTRVNLGNTGESFLINKEKIIISPLRFTDNAILNLKIDTENARKSLLQANKGEDFKNKTDAYTDNFITTNYRDIEVLGGYAYIPGMQWGVLVEIDVAEALAPINNLKNLTLIITIIVFILVMIIAFSTAQAISKPIERLQKGIEFIGKGNLDYKVGTKAKDEIGHLSRAFDKMMQDLNKKNKKIETLNSNLILSTKVLEKNKKILFEKNQFFDKMVSKTPLAFIYFDTDYKIQIWNQAAETIFGYTAKEALGENIVDLIVPDAIKKEIDEVIEFVFDESTKQNQQNENITKSGKRIICNWYNTAIKDENDKVIGLSSIVEDITEYHKIAQDLENTNQNLQEMVYIASHDLQVPLVSLVGYTTDLLENNKDNLDEEGIYCLTRIQVNAQRMHQLVLSLLDISRLNTHINPFHKFNLSKLIEKILKDISLTIEKTNAVISYNKSLHLFADKERIEGVFRNLILNSLNYGAKTVEIGVLADTFFVKDDGIGIPKDQLKKIFLPGERLKMTKAEGVGMGLTFCKKVIEKHSGTIWAASEGLNKGTTIFFKLHTNT